MFGMFRVVKYYLAMKKVGSESFNSQMAIICPGGKLNNFKFQILLTTGDANLYAAIWMVFNGILTDTFLFKNSKVYQNFRSKNLKSQLFRRKFAGIENFESIFRKLLEHFLVKILFPEIVNFVAKNVKFKEKMIFQYS